MGIHFQPKVSKKNVSDLMIYDVSGTPFWKVEMLIWCHGIPSFSKVKTASQKPGKTKGLGLHFRPKVQKREPQTL